MGCGEWVGGTSLCLTPTSGGRDQRRIGVGGAAKAASSLVRKGVVGERRPDPENQGGLLFSFMTIPTLAQALASRRFSASICHINEQTSGFSLTRSWLNFEAEGKEGCQFGGPPKPHPPPLTSKNQSLPLSKGVWVRALGHHPDSVTFELCDTEEASVFHACKMGRDVPCSRECAVQSCFSHV